VEIFNLKKHWGDFLKGTIAINCPTQELAKELLTYCHNTGIKWNNGNTLIDWNYLKQYYSKDISYDIDNRTNGINILQVFHDKDFVFLGFNKDNKKNIEFNDATSWRYIGNGIYIKDMFSWMKNDYAGEGLYQMSETNKDGSGCLIKNREEKVCNKPTRTIVRGYKKDDIIIYASLAYPNQLGGNEGYLWEVECNNNPRFESEKDMEDYIINYFSENENNKIGRLIYK